jgi:hypothetical protein
VLIGARSGRVDLRREVVRKKENSHGDAGRQMSRQLKRYQRSRVLSTKKQFNDPAPNSGNCRTNGSGKPGRRNYDLPMVASR